MLVVVLVVRKIDTVYEKATATDRWTDSSTGRTGLQGPRHAQLEGEAEAPAEQSDQVGDGGTKVDDEVDSGNKRFGREWLRVSPVGPLIVAFAVLFRASPRQDSQEPGTGSHWQHEMVSGKNREQIDRERCVSRCALSGHDQALCGMKKPGTQLSESERAWHGESAACGWSLYYTSYVHCMAMY